MDHPRWFIMFQQEKINMPTFISNVCRYRVNLVKYSLLRARTVGKNTNFFILEVVDLKIRGLGLEWATMTIYDEKLDKIRR
jgi:hypothetical protein